MWRDTWRRGHQRTRVAARGWLATIGFLLCACADGGDGASTLVVSHAGSLARPLRAAAAAFDSVHDDANAVAYESAGSLEAVRRFTELGRVPDLIALADTELFPPLLASGHVRWYAEFARDRMVIAHTPRSRAVHELTVDGWPDVLARPDVEVGRSDPDLDPAGYRALLALQLAERHYARAGLAATVLARAPRRNVRPRSADLVALLQAGELDYAWLYESVARSAGLDYLRLPSPVDLGAAADSVFYTIATVRVVGPTRGDSIEMRGRPIVFALSVPAAAPHREMAEVYAAFLLSPAGRLVLRGAGLDVLPRPRLVGDVPDSVRAAAVSWIAQ